MTHQKTLRVSLTINGHAFDVDVPRNEIQRVRRRLRKQGVRVSSKEVARQMVKLAAEQGQLKIPGMPTGTYYDRGPRANAPA